MKTGGLYLLIGAGLLAAGAVWAQSSVIVNQLRAPDRAAKIGLPPQGWVKASQSRTLQTARLTKNPKSSPGKMEKRLAEDAFAMEPLARSAWPVLAQSLVAAGKPGRSGRFLELAGSLSRRDNLLNALLIDQAMERGEPQQALRLLGRAMSVDHGTRQLYLRRMASATADPGAEDVLVPLLGRNPNWGPGYWSAVLEESRALPQAGEIRLRIAGQPWELKTPASTDFPLIANLANQNQQALAYEIARALGIGERPDGEILTGSSFERRPRFLPFEWELFQTGDIGAVIEPKTRTLSISSLPAASGVVARQMVRIPGAGFYRLRWKLTGLDAVSGASLKLRLTCAEANKVGGSITPFRMAEGEGSAIIPITASTCNWHIVTLELDAPDSAVGSDIVLQRLSLRRDGRGFGGKTPQIAGH